MDHSPTAQSAPSCILAGTLPSGERFKFAVGCERFTVGRLPSNQVQLKNETVSGIHAEFVPLGSGRFRVRDLDSMNGLFVNGVPVADKEIAAPCRILVGGVVCVLEVEPPPVSRSPESAPAQKAVSAPATRRSVGRLLAKSAAVLGIATLIGGWSWSFTRPPARGETPERERSGESFARIEPAPMLVALEIPAPAEIPADPVTQIPEPISPPDEAAVAEISAELDADIADNPPEPDPEVEAPPPAEPEPSIDTADFFASIAAGLDPALAATAALWTPREAIIEAALRTRPKAPAKAPEPLEPAPAPAPADDITVLILGDSLALCGFGKRLDTRFREAPSINAAYTYMACGTVPLSWLKVGNYAKARTCCGFWSIESVTGKEAPKVVQDTYGMKRGYRPKPHQVPKIEDLLQKFEPDILIVQTGTNLFGLFPDCKTISPDRHEAMLKTHIEPFVSRLLATNSSLRKIYWVGSPTSGRVTDEIQDFVVERYRKFAGGSATVIDSRTLITYPYTGMQPDGEHFLGADMERWADKVFDNVMRDFSTGKLPPPLAPPVVAQTTPEQDEAAEVLAIKAKLVFKSPPLRASQIMPYQESLVAYVYDVVKVVGGHYEEKQILVMHPAHVRLQQQALNKYRVGKTYDLRLRDLDTTPWVAIKSSDQSGKIELLPYIQLADDAKFPARGE
ncbi:MAG: FHA domain-containing protein [Chthoniobacteraceae bacterium]